MPLPTKVIANQGTIVQVILLPDGVREAPSYRITFTSGGAVGATTISVQATPVFLQADLRLIVGTRSVVLADDAPAGSTSLNVLPLANAITIGEFANTQAPLQLLGVTDASINSSTNTVDTSNFKSGYGMESKTTGVDRTVSVSLNQIDGDRALDTIIKRILFNDALAEREVYAWIFRPNSESYRGAAQVRNVNQPTAMRDIAKMTFELQFQGKSFQFGQSRAYAS